MGSMDAIGNLTTFFGWCSILNIGYLVIVGLFVMFGRNWAAKMHNKFYGISKEEVTNEYFRFMANYKIFTLVFSIVPWVALKIMG